MIDLYNGDCLIEMQKIPDESVDMILTDPPYGTVKGVNLDGWEEKTNWDNQINHTKLLKHCNRILRPNGSLLLFSQEPYTSKLIAENHPNLPFSYRYTWLKDHFANPLSAKKAPVNYVEDICVFFKSSPKHDYHGYHPLRKYAEKLFMFIGKSKRDIFNDLGNQSVCHFMRYNTAQFTLCTKKTYEALIEKYKFIQKDWYLNYDELKKIDRNYRHDLIKKMTEKNPKIFNLKHGDKYKSNVLKYKKEYMGLHPTQKPVKLLEDLIYTYTNEGDVVLDFTMGSGSTGVASLQTNRKFIGIELDKKYFNIAEQRIKNTEGKANKLQ